MNCLVCANDILDVFYSAFDNKGCLEIYCYRCYQKNVLESHPGMIDGGGTKLVIKCECGKDKHGFAMHSNWCPKV